MGCFPWFSLNLSALLGLAVKKLVPFPWPTRVYSHKVCWSHWFLGGEL